jgi:hypothetical protein
MPQHSELNALVQDFIGRLASLVQEETEVRAREAVMSAFGAPRAVSAVSAPRHKANPRRQLQGRYIGLLKRAKGKDRERVRALYSSKGVEAAIGMLQGLAARAN